MGVEMPIRLFHKNAEKVSDDPVSGFGKIDKEEKKERRKGWFKRFISSSLLGIGLAVNSAGLVNTACSSKKGISQDQGTITQAMLTDDQGNATFNLNGRTFSINVLDGNDMAPVSGLIAMLALKGQNGVYMLSDSEDRYFPRLFSADDDTGAVISNILNVILYPTDSCHVNEFRQITGVGIDELYEQRAIDTSVLNRHFDKIEQEPTLS